MVLFNHRSGKHTGNPAQEQLKLLGLHTVGLIGGAISLFVLRTFCLKLIARNTHEAAAMNVPLVMTMVWVGLFQSLAMWALASRWLKVALLYGGLGCAYWLTLPCLGKSPADLLRLMPVAAGIAFVILFVFGVIALRKGKTNPSTQC
ncbi:MAG: hypothetical protein ABSH11_05600 [Verrucomicrobiota bacterium]|jgi:hypothetical protein